MSEDAMRRARTIDHFHPPSWIGHPQLADDDGTHLDAELDIRDLDEIRYWTEQWNVTEVELRKAIAEVGINLSDLSVILGKAIYGSNHVYQAGLESGGGHTTPA